MVRSTSALDLNITGNSFPTKKCGDFIFEDSGKFMVDSLGFTDRLSMDFSHIFANWAFLRTT